MFNNPFHRVAAEAKGEREQLDRLLRISAPHERIVLAAAALVVAAFAAWLLFGTVLHSVTVEGVLIEPGKRHTAFSAKAGQLLGYLVAPGDRVEAGQPIARQSLPDLDREINALRDRVAVLQAALERSGSGSESLRPLLASAQTALLQMEARRSAQAGNNCASRGCTVSSILSAPGELSAGRRGRCGGPRSGSRRPLQAVLRADPGACPPPQDRHGGVGRGRRCAGRGIRSRLQGRVARKVEGPLPGWLARLDAGCCRRPSRRIDIVLRRNAGFRASRPALPAGSGSNWAGRRRVALLDFGRP